MRNTPPPDREEHLFESLITGLMDKGFGFCDQFLEPDILTGLRTNLLNHFQKGEMRPAGVGRNFDFQKNAAIRGDVIRWLDPESGNRFEKAFLTQVGRFISHLNATCYTGINGCEFHYAYYVAGSFYKRHIDRFKSDKGRLFSFVMYLNDAWEETDGGQLSLYLNQGEVSLLPTQGRVVFFRSDQTEHKVYPSPSRARLSIAGWLKKT